MNYRDIGDKNLNLPRINQPIAMPNPTPTAKPVVISGVSQFVLIIQDGNKGKTNLGACR